MPYDFQITYTVSPHDKDDTNSANTARKEIREMKNTKKLEDIETTLIGKMELSSSLTKTEKREKAEKIIDYNITKILKDHKIYTNVDVHISLMVDGLGKHIQFKV